MKSGRKFRTMTFLAEHNQRNCRNNLWSGEMLRLPGTENRTTTVSSRGSTCKVGAWLRIPERQRGVPMRKVIGVLLAGFTLVGILMSWEVAAGQSQTSPLPELPADLPKDAEIRTFLIDKTPQGQDAVWKDADGTIHEFFQFNDRGRGPKIYSTYRLNAAGIVVEEASKGVDYMKNPVTENFLLREYEEGDFYRAFSIHESIDSSRIEAECKNGVLIVHLPKTEAVRPRQIAVRS